MALNLGATLRDAVDGPADGLDDLVGEDPADVDLAALSARIRRRRRARAATRSAVGAVAVGAVAFAVAGGGLDGRGAQTYSGGPASALSAADQSLCGRDVAAMPSSDGARLAPANVAVVSDGSGNVGLVGDASNLGTLVGRTLTATLVQESATGTPTGTVVLTKGPAVVAVGPALPGPAGDAAVEQAADGTVDTFSAVSADLAPCPTAGTTPANVPAGTYTVQYLVQGADGPRRSVAGPWLVTLLDPPAAVTLPDGYPSGDAPVISGKLLVAVPRTDHDGWVVQVAVDGDDAVTRAAGALRDAGAVVSMTATALVGQTDGGYPTRSWFEDGASPADRQAALAALQDELAQLQAQRDTATAEVAAGQQAYDALVAADARSDSLSWAARQLQAAKDAASTLDQEIGAKQLEVAAQQALVDQSAGTANQEELLATARAAAAASPTETYTIVGPTSLQATTRAWSIDVTQTAQGGSTVLTYTVTGR